MFFKKKLVDDYNKEVYDLRGLWVTSTKLFPALHGSSSYINNLSYMLGSNVKLDLAYYLDENEYKENPRIYQTQFLNIFHIPRPALKGFSPIHSGLNTYSSIISSNLVNWIRDKFKKNKYDFIICDYVYLAPIFDYVPENVVKIINTHDVYGDRHNLLGWSEIQKKQSFCISIDDENSLLERSDIIISITEKERFIFQERLKNNDKNISTVCIKYYPKKTIVHKPKKINKTFNIGFIGSSNPVNTDGIIKYIDYLSKFKIENITFILAGLICYKVKDQYPWLIKKYELKKDELQEFYDSIDLIVNPMPQKTTGLKIKTIESVINDIPIIGTNDAFTGLDNKSKWHSATNIKELAGFTIQLSEKPKLLNEIKTDGIVLKNSFLLDSKNEVHKFLSTIQSKKSLKSIHPLKALPGSVKYHNKKLTMVTMDYINSLEKANIRINDLVERVEQLYTHIKPNYQGHVSVISSSGIYQDSWCKKECNFLYIAKSDISIIEISIFNPLLLNGKITINLGDFEESYKITQKNTKIKIPYFIKKDTTNRILFISDLNSSNDRDTRKLSFLLSNIIFN